MSSRLLDKYLLLENWREAIQEVVESKFTEVTVSQLEQWQGAIRPPGMRFIKVFAQIINLKRQDKKLEKTYAFRDRRDPGADVKRTFTVDRDTRMVLLRCVHYCMRYISRMKNQLMNQ